MTAIILRMTIFSAFLLTLSTAWGEPLRFVDGVCPQIRTSPASYPPILRDLHSRVDDPEYWRLTDKTDLVSWVHELNHGASFQSCTPEGSHGIYLLNGRALVLPNPKVTIKQVADSISKRDRGPNFSHYLITQRKDWNDHPLYLLDEWTAYTHGAIAHKQLGMGTLRSETYSFAMEFERYCRALLVVVEKQDPDYQHTEQLRLFIEWNADRLPECPE